MRWQRVVYKLRRPSLSPPSAARGGAAVREGPAGRQLLPASGGGLCDKAEGWRSSLSPSPHSVREKRESCVSPGPRRACPAPAASAGSVPGSSSPAGSTLPAALPGALPVPSPASSRWASWRWGSLRQRQTKAQRRPQPPPPGLGSAARLPAARRISRRGQQGGGDAEGAVPGGARAGAVQSGGGGGMRACALRKQEVERPH